MRESWGFEPTGCVVKHMRWIYSVRYSGSNEVLACGDIEGMSIERVWALGSGSLQGGEYLGLW